MSVLLARHGQTDWNIAHKVQGSTDIPLNENGIRQAHDLYENLSKEGLAPVKIYSSYQKRAKDTAEIVGKACGAFVKVISGLEEMNLGVFEGHTWDEIEAMYPEDLSKWHSDKRYLCPPEGECYQDVLVRFFKALDEILVDAENELNEDKNVLIVTHGAVIMSVFTVLQNLDFKDSYLQIEVPNAKAIRLEMCELECVREKL